MAQAGQLLHRPRVLPLVPSQTSLDVIAWELHNIWGVGGAALALSEATLFIPWISAQNPYLHLPVWPCAHMGLVHSQLRALDRVGPRDSESLSLDFPPDPSKRVPGPLSFSLSSSDL